MQFIPVNYQTYMIVCGKMLQTITNSENQQFDLAKNQLRNSDHKIIVFYHAEKLAYQTDFYEIDYFLTGNPAAKPYFCNGKLVLSHY